MDGGGELGKCRDIHRTFANFGYAVELTGPDSSHQNGPGGVHIRRSAMLFAPCFPVRISSPTSGRMHSTTTFACITSSPRRSTYKPIRDVWCPSPKSGKATDLWMSDPRSSNDCSIRSRRSELPPRYFLGYSRSLKVMYYFDLGSSTVKTATHARFDEGMNDLDEPPPNVKLLRNLADDGVVGPDRLDLPAFNLEVSDDPFERLDELSPSITCEHPCLGFEIMECHIRRREQSLGSFTRRKLRRLPNWKEWQDAEFKQLDSMAKQEMYGALFLLPEMLLCSATLELRHQRRRFSESKKLLRWIPAQLHSSSWLTPILAASNNLVCAFSLLCVLMRVILYQGTYKGHRMLICRQVDDMAIGCVNVDAIKDLVRVICAEDGIDLRDEGILNSFNGVDVDQRDRYIKITCETYIDKLLAHYGWSSSGSRETDEKPIEPLAASTTQQMFDDYANAPRDGTAEYYDLETAAGFSYRSVLGALIYAYVVARPDIGYAVTTLARFSDHPAKVHYDALRRVARYLRMTKNWGLFYWRNVLLSSLPPGDFKILIPDSSLPDFPQVQSSTELAGYVDAAHATDLVTRRSITGLVFMFCGGPLAYKSKIQSTVSTSSTEAEFLAAVHAAKIAKYLRSILSELGYAQLGPTTLFEDNAAAILMVNASRPTPRARHIDIQHFALQEWKAANEIVLSHIPGVVNSADSLTKSLGSTLHHRHVRRLMGHYGAPWIPPAP
ncbi:hypothetical protein MHU86_23589 [Fragilaria crotonensis]|nr:hypothetical protein MHU86_23589 [Fragilaria crotonensis]